MPLHFFVFAEEDSKKHTYASAKASNTTLVKPTDGINKNDHVIMCCFSVSDKHGQTSKVFDTPQHGF